MCVCCVWGVGDGVGGIQIPLRAHKLTSLKSVVIIILCKGTLHSDLSSLSAYTSTPVFRSYSIPYMAPVGGSSSELTSTNRLKALPLTSAVNTVCPRAVFS